MSAELRLKKLRGSGGYVMAKVSDEQQGKGNLGGPDLFLAPIGRLDQDKITKYFCNTCEKEFDDSPKIDYENPNEVVAENLVLKERGQYLCNTCGSTLAEYREFSKQDEAGEVGAAKSLADQETAQQETQQTLSPQESPPQQTVSPQKVAESTQTQPQQTEQTHPTSGSVSSIEGLSVYDESAKKIGVAKQLGIDDSQSLVLILTKNDGNQGTIPWNKVKKVGEIILLGTPQESQAPPPQVPAGKCPSCGFDNKPGSKFCEECGTKLQ